MTKNKEEEKFNISILSEGYESLENFLEKIEGDKVNSEKFKEILESDPNLESCKEQIEAIKKDIFEKKKTGVKIPSSLAVFLLACSIVFTALGLINLTGGTEEKKDGKALLQAAGVFFVAFGMTAAIAGCVHHKNNKIKNEIKDADIDTQIINKLEEDEKIREGLKKILMKSLPQDDNPLEDSSIDAQRSQVPLPIKSDESIPSCGYAGSSNIPPPGNARSIRMQQYIYKN